MIDSHGAQVFIPAVAPSYLILRRFYLSFIIVTKMQSDVKYKLGDLPFHHLLAKDYLGIKSYGVEELIFLNLCNKKMPLSL